MLLLSQAAGAAVLDYQTSFTPLNSLEQIEQRNPTVRTDFPAFAGSTAAGTTRLTLDTDALTLRVRINATGLEAGIPHLSHIHGNLIDNTRPGSGVRDSQVPTLAQDTDGDGFIEVAEGAATYGPVLFDFGVIGDTSTINFDRTFDLTSPDAPFAPVSRFAPDGERYALIDLIGADQMALDLRHIVIHGLTVPFGLGNAGGAPNEVDGTTTFLPDASLGDPNDPFEGTIALPVANGEFELVEVPEPAMLGLFGLGVLGLAAARRRKA